VSIAEGTELRGGLPNLMSMLGLDLLGLRVLLDALRLFGAGRALPVHPAVFVARLGTVATGSPLAGHTLAGNSGGFGGAGAVHTLQLLDLLAELLKNGENLGVFLHVLVWFLGGSGELRWGMWFFWVRLRMEACNHTLQVLDQHFYHGC